MLSCRSLTTLSCTVLLLLISCSGNRGPAIDGSPVVPGLKSGHVAATESNRYLWGVYTISVDAERNPPLVIPARSAEGHWNALKWLEKGPCSNCVSIESFIDSGYGTKLVGVQIQHPFTNPNLAGFDVRGIAMFTGSLMYTGPLYTPDRALGDGEVINADGYTRLFEPSTEGSGPSGLEGYIKGNFATATYPDCNLSAFKRFVSGEPNNDRNYFRAGDAVTVTYDIDMPDGAFIFGYAVDACWGPPVNKPVVDPDADFPPEANCPEPWKIEVSQQPIGLGLTDKGGELRLVIDVYDYQGKFSHNIPTVDINMLYCGPLEADYVSETLDFTRYEHVVHLSGAFDPGFYDCLISVEDIDNATAPAWLDLTAYYRTQVEVTEYAQSGWAVTWGGPDWDGGGYGCAADAFGNVYVVGEFQGTVDFDPGSGVEERTASGGRDAYLAKFNSVGGLVWVRTWGGSQYDYCRNIALDSDGHIYVVGGFSDSFDFDPGPGVTVGTAVSGLDGYVCRYDSDGNFLWLYCIGFIGADWANDVAACGNYFVYVSGTCMDNIIMLCKIFSDGALDWHKGMSAASFSCGYGVDVDEDGNAFMTGGYQGTVDFNPDAGIDNHTSNGSMDCFLTRMDPLGNYEWTKTWGDTSLDAAESIVILNNEYIGDSAFIVGHFSGTVDFDPSGFISTSTSEGGEDAFVSQLDTDGEYLMHKTWGGTGGVGEGDRALDVCMQDLNLLISGQFGSTVDFDWTSGTSELTSAGLTDVYILKMGFNGSFGWVRGWGSTEDDIALGVSSNAYYDCYVTGAFKGTVDFDPSGGIDEHVSNGDRDIFLSKFNGMGEW